VAVSSRVQGLLRFAELGRFDAVHVIHQDPVLLETAFFLLLVNVKLVLHQVQAGEDSFSTSGEEEPKPVPSKGWAEMIHKVFEIDPMLCPQCGGTMKVIAFITDDQTIEG
jgi:hypothetical protein